MGKKSKRRIRDGNADRNLDRNVNRNRKHLMNINMRRNLDRKSATSPEQPLWKSIENNASCRHRSWLNINNSGNFR